MKTENSIKMRKYTLELILIFFLAAGLVECQKWSDYNNVYKNRRGGPSPDENDIEKVGETNIPAKSQQSKSVTRGGIGGWGIIAITLTIIFSGIGIYYFVLFYPIVCKKERMYDVMEMTTV